MKILHLSGSPFEIGFQHGKQAREEVHFSIDSYEKLFFNNIGLSWKDAIEEAKTYLDYIESTDITLLEEMDGIAKGSGMDFHDILTLNSRSEIILAKNNSDGCTSVSIMPPLGDNVYLAQTWDWRASQARSIIMTKIEQEDRPTIQMATEGGLIGKIGFNSSGLGACANAIVSSLNSKKLPIHLGLRVILNSINLDEVVGKISKGILASSANFLLAQDDGKGRKKAVNLEISPAGVDKKITEDSYLYHANHLCSRILTNKIEKSKLVTEENSFVRSNRIRELIKKHEPDTYSVNGGIIKNWLSDHENVPHSICRHRESEISHYTDVITVFAVIMNLSERTMHFMKGQTCNPTIEKHLQL